MANRKQTMIVSDNCGVSIQDLDGSGIFVNTSTEPPSIWMSPIQEEEYIRQYLEDPRKFEDLIKKARKENAKVNSKLAKLLRAE